MNVVICVHPNSSGRYMFKVPENVQLRAGDIVTCSTKRDQKAIAMCVTDSFTPGDPEMIARLWGSNVKGMRPVTARLNPEAFVYEPAEESDPAEEAFD